MAEDLTPLESDTVGNFVCHQWGRTFVVDQFAELQKRRSQTEARIGIFKNVFLGGRLRAKGFENRKRALAWAVLAHNLWVLVRMEWREEEATAKPKAA